MMINLSLKKLNTWLIFISLMLVSLSTFAQNMVVIVNVNNTENISREMIKQIYSDKRNFWETGDEIVLFELPVKDRGREIFAKALLNKSAITSQSDWSNRYVKNTIKNKVKMKPQKLVARFVSINKNAIGYIPESMAEKQNNIKIIMTINDY
jgi:ABC-type phosphate transport system substrate-binding protein